MSIFSLITLALFWVYPIQDEVNNQSLLNVDDVIYQKETQKYMESNNHVGSKQQKSVCNDNKDRISWNLG